MGKISKSAKQGSFAVALLALLSKKKKLSQSSCHGIV